MDVVTPILQISGAIHVINKLIDAATTYVRDQYYWKTDLQEELQSLRDLHPQIQVVVDFAENNLTSYESSNPALVEWLWQFREVIDEAEEVLDELEYFELEKKANDDKSRLSRMVDASVKAAKKLLKYDDVIGRLRACVKNLKTHASNVNNFLALVKQTAGIGTGQMQQEILPLTDQSRITNPLPVLSFKGREEVKGKIIQYLLGESVEESEIQISQNVHCLPLVAMGGMGKTALAKQVFHHFKNVKKEHFDIKIWVCDSLPYLNASNLMKKILEELTGRSESVSLERLPVRLQNKLRSQKFLLVLDDAWDDKNKSEWEKLCDPLLYGQKGSWILLTTRLESVAKMVLNVIRGDTIEPMKLPSLSKDECLSLLYEYAFVRHDPDKFPELTNIGKEVVKKLDGIPLLAKSIGGALNEKLNSDHWMIISNSEVWKMPQDSNYEFISALTLSYKRLSPDLKRCFSYCSIFPQDYQFNKQKLVCMWMAAGLIYSNGSQGSDEDIANGYFETLCNKSFFDFHTYNRDPLWESIMPPKVYDTATDFYTMHAMLNGLARHVSRYEYCRIEHGTPSYNFDDNVIRHIRHISITSTDAQLHDLTKKVCKFKYLRTLWIEYDGHPQKLDDFIRDVCKSPRRIRVLIMQSYQCLKSISDFVKLRFLDISAHLQPPSLSISICKFYFLQVLIDDGYRRPNLAKDVNKLTNLRHLYGVQEDALLSVAEVGKLTSLRELCFAVGTEPRYRIDELMNIDKLHQLKIKQLSNVRSREEAKMVNLVGKKSHLTRLELDWNGVSNPDDVSNPDEVSNPDLHQQGILAALQPPPTIRKLCIRHYEGGSPAPWMDTLSLSLESLELYACKSTTLEEMTTLWKLRCLKYLKLDGMKAIVSLGYHFSHDQMPVLEKLKFRDFPLWEEWNGADYIWSLRLKSFEIENCPKLKKIPDLPLYIRNLRMEKLGIEALPRFYQCSNGSRTIVRFQQLMSLESLKIYNCPRIVKIGSIGEEDDHLLTSSLKTLFPSSLKTLELDIDERIDLASYLRGLILLTTLHLHCSPGLESLPLASELDHLTALQDLGISDGEALTSPGGLYILNSLKSLEISNCPKFFSAEVESQEFLKDKTRKNAASSSSVFDPSASNTAASILPSSLESLKFKNSDISQESLGQCLQGLTSLKKLKVLHCHHLASLPNIKYLRNLTALQTLRIYDCKELCELKSLMALVSLRELKIDCCPKLQNSATTTEQSRTLPSLKSIIIDNIFYLPILPIPIRLNTLRIRIKKGNPLTDAKFTEGNPLLVTKIKEWLLQCRESLELLQLEWMPHLQSLHASLENFVSLKYLSIYSTSELKSLVRMPASLKELTISGCSTKLEKRCQKNIGQDWLNINHIPYIVIEAGKEDKVKPQVNCNCVSNNRLWSST